MSQAVHLRIDISHQMVTFDMSAELHHLRFLAHEVVKLRAVGTLVGAGRNRLRLTRISLSLEGARFHSQ